MRTVRASGALTMNLAAQALGQSDGVWQVLAGEFTGVFEPAASTTHVGLDLVHDQQGALLAGEFTGTGEVTCEQRQDAGLPLDGFDDEGSDVVGQIFFEGFEGSGYMFDAGGKRFEGLTVGGLPGEGKSPDSSPVEAVVKGEDGAFAVEVTVAAGKFIGSFVGFSAGVAEKDFAIIGAQVTQQAVGQRDLLGAGEEVRDVG